MKTETSVVTTKGRLVVPARLRRRFGIKEGTMVTFIEIVGVDKEHAPKCPSRTGSAGTPHEARSS